MLCQCPACATILRVAKKALQRVVCAFCGAAFLVAASSEPHLPEPPVSAPPVPGYSQFASGSPSTITTPNFTLQ